MTTKAQKLAKIEIERLKALNTIYEARDRIAELNTQRQNIIMKED